MKKIIIVIFAICLFACNGQSQVVFNRIIEDTIAHITCSVLALDTGYIIMTGTGNEYGIRSYAFRFIDANGEIQWKKIIGDSQNQYWEGLSNCIQKNENYFYSSGSIIDNSTYYSGIYLYLYNNYLDSLKCEIYLFNNIWKRGFNVIRNFSGDYYVTGQVYDSALDDAFMYLLKIDSVGNLIWDKRYGQRNESGDKIIITRDNNILVGGATFSFPTTVTDEDWYLIKLDTAGNVIWQNGFGRPGFLNYDGPVKGMIETRDSNYVACGKYPALRSDTDTYWDGCLRKVSTDGVLMWERFFRSYTFYPPVGPTTMKCSFNSIIQKENDDLLIVGNSYESYPRHRGFLMCTDKNGNIKWHRLYYAETISSRSQYLTVLQPTQDNGFILAGYGDEYDLLGYAPAQQAWLVKTDSLGIDGLCYTEPPELNIDIILPETLNCSDTITVYAYISGKSAPYTIETSVGQVIDTIYYPPLFVPVEIGLSLAEIDYGGNIIYSQQITEATLSNHEWGQCIAKPVEFYTPHTSGSQQISITVTDAYGESKMILKDVFVNDCGSGIAEEEINSVNVYPNPAVDNLYLDITESVISAPLNHLLVNCEIYNSMGQLVKTLQLSNDLTVINIKDFTSGVYQIKIIDGDGNVVVRSFEKQ